MRKNLIRISTLAGLAVAALGLVSCEQEVNPIVISSVHHLVPDANGGGCSPEQDLASGSGTAYVRSIAEQGAYYAVYLRIRNAMPDNSDEAAGRVTTTNVQLTRVEIRYDGGEAWSFLPRKRVLSAGIEIDPQGELWKAVDVIDSELGALMLRGGDGAASPIASGGACAPLLVTFKAYGRMGDGTEVESNELDYPVTLCNVYGGCVDPEQSPVGCTTGQPDGFTCE